MSPDRTRASDSEREDAVAVLRQAAAEGRLSLDELDERTSAAYGAATRGELARVLDDLPAKAPAGRAHKRPRFPGRTGFTVRWRAPARPEEAGQDLLEFVAPPMRAYGYELVEQTPERLVFERRYHPVWTFAVALFVFPLGLVALLHTADERITIELLPRGEDTLVLAQGTAPLRIRRALAELED
jgi:hypothetical protein